MVFEAENPEKLRLKLENQIVALIKTKLEDEEMTVEKAKQIAKLVLKRLHPGMTYKQLMKVIPTLDDDFTELAGVILPIMLEHDRKLRKIVDEHVAKLVKEGKIEEAESLLQEISK